MACTCIVALVFCVRVVMYGSEVWTLNKSDDNTLAVWKIKVLRRIFDTVKENGATHQLMNLYENQILFQKSEKED